MEFGSTFEIGAAWLLVACAAFGLWRVCAGVGRSVQLLSAGYVTFGVLGAFAYRPTALDATGGNAQVVASFDRTSPLAVVALFGVVAILCCVGALVARAVGSDTRTAPSQTRILQVPSSWLIGPAAVLALNIWGVGWHTLWHARYYLDRTGPLTAQKLSSAAAPIGVLVAANILLSRQRGWLVRGAACLVLALTAAVAFGEATRLLSIMPILVFLGGYITGRWSARAAVVAGAIAALASLALLGPPLVLRGQVNHGLSPALGYLRTQPAALFLGVRETTSNLLQGVPVTTYVANAVPPLPLRDLWVSVNPLPGIATSWPKISQTLRINRFEPYSGLGELANYGWWAVILGSIATGAVFQACEASAVRIRSSLGSAMRVAIVGTAALVVITSTEYNLRTEARLIYYLIVGTAATWIISRTRVGDARKHSATPRSVSRSGLSDGRLAGRRAQPEATRLS